MRVNSKKARLNLTRKRMVKWLVRRKRKSSPVLRIHTNTNQVTKTTMAGKIPLDGRLHCRILDCRPVSLSSDFLRWYSQLVTLLETRTVDHKMPSLFAVTALCGAFFFFTAFVLYHHCRLLAEVATSERRLWVKTFRAHVQCTCVCTWNILSCILQIKMIISVPVPDVTWAKLTQAQRQPKTNCLSAILYSQETRTVCQEKISFDVWKNFAQVFEHFWVSLNVSQLHNSTQRCGDEKLSQMSSND